MANKTIETLTESLEKLLDKAKAAKPPDFELRDELQEFAALVQAKCLELSASIAAKQTE